MFKQAIISELKKHVKADFSLEVPPDHKLGDFAFPCFTLAKEFKKSPVQIAQELAGKIKVQGVRVSATGPYVNFFLDTAGVAKSLMLDILTQKKRFASSRDGEGRIVGIDFSSPNIGKPLHFGNLRTTMLGNSIARLHEFAGFNVLRLNYLGDWGTQFGTLIHAYLTWGDKKRFKEHPVEHLVELYVRFNKEAENSAELKEKAREWFAKLEKGDAMALKLWSKFKHLCLDELRGVYKTLGITFDSFNGEAFYAPKVEAALERVQAKGLAVVDDGALIIRMQGSEMPMMLRKRDGSTTYASRDVATVLDRIETLKCNKLVYVVGHEQSQHFQHLFALMKLLGYDKEFVHVSYGLYLSQDGSKMSTRKGTGISMEGVLNEAIALAKKTIEEKNPGLKDKEKIACDVAIGAIFFGDMMNDRSKDIVFDLDRFVSFEGDTGPYLMYTHARAASIVRKGKEQKVSPKKAAKFEVLKHPAEDRVIKLLSAFPQKVKEALAVHKPHVLAQYLLEVGHAFNEFYHSCPCLQEENKDLKVARLTLIEASRQILENGLRLLGITAPFE